MIKNEVQQKSAMALLITLLFIILITLAIGVGLKQLKDASNSLAKERFLYQSSIIVDDVLKLLKDTPDLKSIKTDEDIKKFLSYSPIQFETAGLKIIINLESARSKYNINAIVDRNNSVMLNRVEYLKKYFSNHMINVDFVDILLDGLSGIKGDNSYNSEIFNENPNLFRDYIVSQEHFEEFKKFYDKFYDTENIKNINYENLFYFAKNINGLYKVDLNFATKEVWEMMLGCDKARAEELSSKDDYKSYESIGLSSEELKAVKDIFRTSLFEPFIYVDITILHGVNTSEIKFEYDIKKRKGSNFIYDIH